MSYPTWEQIFDKPPLSTCTVECPEAWRNGSRAVEVADREIVRLLENCMYDPPILEEEIEKYAAKFRMSKRDAEQELRRNRDAS